MTGAGAGGKGTTKSLQESLLESLWDHQRFRETLLTGTQKNPPRLDVDTFEEEKIECRAGRTVRSNAPRVNVIMNLEKMLFCSNIGLAPLASKPY